MKGYVEISKTDFYNLGAWENSGLVRKADSAGVWRYYKSTAFRPTIFGNH